MRRALLERAHHMAVYDAFYGFRQSPFRISPDPDFLFLSRSHREGLAGLIYAIGDRKGFALLTGEVGTGKTTLVHALLSQLGDRVRTAFVFNPHLSRADLYQDLLGEFRLPPAASVSVAVRALQHFLIEQYRAGVPVVLILDEAHALSLEIIEEVRFLSNFEAPGAKLLQVLLVGQPEIWRRLATDELRALRQRLTVRLELSPLSLGETREYVRDRLRRAGRREPLFADAALLALHEYAGGLPRAINTLADNALLIGLARDRERIDASLVRAAAAQLGVSRRIRVGLWERLRRPPEPAATDGEMVSMAEFVERLLEPGR